MGPNSNSIRWIYTATNFISSSPALATDGTIYFGGWDNQLYALHADGTLKWTFPTGGYISSSPAVDANGVVYVGSWDHNIYAVNPNGTLKWIYPTNDIVTSSPTMGPDGIVYVGSWDDSVYALAAPASGITATLSWKYTTGSYVTSSPALSGTTVYVGSWDNHLYALTAPASGLTATVVFSYTAGDYVVGSPTVGGDGTIYFGSYDKKLYALDANGNLKWSFLTEGNIKSTPAIGIDGTIFVNTSWDGLALGQDEALYAITWSGGPTGSLRWKKLLGYTGTDPSGDQMVSTPIVGTDGTVYLGAKGFAPEGLVYALNPADGATAWSYTAGNIIEATPAIGADGTLYIGSYDNRLYAFSTAVNPPTASADLALSASGQPASVQVGQAITYTAQVNNKGPDSAVNVSVVDPLPAGLSYRSASATQGTCSLTSAVVCDLGALSSGANATVVIAAGTTETGTVANNLTVESDTGDPNAANNSALVTTTVTSVPQPAADLSLAASGVPALLQVGDAVTYTLVVLNHGPDAAASVQVTDTLPAGLAERATNSSQGGCTGTSTITCNLGSINSGSTATVSIAATANVTGSLSSSIRVTSSTPDPDATNNAALLTTTVIENPPMPPVWLPLMVR